MSHFLIGAIYQLIRLKKLDMKKHTIFNEPLLLSQLDIAMLLGITRTQWNMYTTGQRGLPARSKLNYKKLLQNANESFLAKREKLAQIAQQENEIQKELETLLQTNTFKQLQVQRKLTKMEAQFEAALNTLYFVRNDQNSAINKSLIKVLEIKALKALDKNALQHQEVHKIKLEVLEFEKKVLLKKMKSDDNDGLF